jgi:hypothetical protein
MSNLHPFPHHAALLILALAFSGCSIAGGYQIDDGVRMPRSYRTVAGNVTVGRDASIHEARTVAGTIAVENGASTRSLKTTAGEIRLGESVKVDGDVSTLAGSIQIGKGSHVTGMVTLTAGSMELNGCHIDGLVRITKGDLRTAGATVLPAGLIVRHTRVHNDDRETPRIDIGPGADIASIEVEPDTPVELRISRDARVGKVTGATATAY